ncbi:MAG: penicillin acylase family protein [Geminicoccaceae bacterium]
MRLLLRWLGWTLAGLVVLVAAVTGGGYWWLRQSLPQVDGAIEVAGLEAPVTIVRDRFAIPHIEAESLLDATFGLGFAHAQDRLWQMEFRRRLGAGRLAEILGAAALPSDRFMRTLGLYRLAKANLAHLEPETIAWLEAYADGVNAFLESRTGPLPPEFLILGHTDPEPWRPADSLVWIRLMALDLGVNYRDELLRARLARRLSDEQIADIWPDYPDDAPTTLVEVARALPWDALAAALPPAPPGGIGSNAWVVAGSRTTTGAPLLANDPHLGLRAPGVWYLAHLKAPEIELVGASMPGLPGIVLGHNGTIAWGFTNTGADVQDLFVERIDPRDPARYLTPSGTAPFATREEIIRIKGAPAVTVTVRATRHGPVISDLVPDAARLFQGDTVVALAWTALAEDDLAAQALLGMGRARDWRQFVEALRDLGAPMQNIHYADASGHIGFIAPGRVPLRRKGDGRWPVPGWTGAFDWDGRVPFDALPRVLDPQDGVLFNANNRVVPEDYPYLLTADWEAPYRARRLAQLLDAAVFRPQDLAAIQGDRLSLLAQDLLPIMLAAEPSGPEAAAAMARLAAWDRVMRPDAAEPLLFAAWYRELSRLIYADELGDLFSGFWGVRPQLMHRILTDREIWCDDIDTAPVETCAGRAAVALDAALLDLARRFGADPTAWRWGDAHVARMAHQLFEREPLLGRLFDIEIASGGDSVTVNVGHYRPGDPHRPFASTHAAGYRAIYDLADLDRSSFVAATGQSGNPLSRHYRDLTGLWAKDQAVAIERAPQAYRRGGIGELRLHPRPAQAAS